jgi:glycosyltransferase involved in cell wall biosynthesis
MSQNTNQHPEITIITPSYNRANFLNKAIESVLRQDHPNFEHIIIDGGSADGTLELLAKYPHVKVVSEPDLGIYDALNKGLNLARGEFIGFLNTDDFYAQGSFQYAADTFEKTKIDAVAGQTSLFIQREDGINSVIRQSKILTERTLWRELIFANPGFNGWFFKRRVFDQVGHFDSTYRITGDRDFLIRFLLSGIPYKLGDQFVYNYRVHDSSITFSQNPRRILQMADENLQLAEHYAALVPTYAAQDLKRQRTRTTISVSSRYLSAGSYRKAFYYMQVGIRHDSFWPIKFVLGFFRGAFREIKRRLGFYPSF